MRRKGFLIFAILILTFILSFSLISVSAEEVTYGSSFSAYMVENATGKVLYKKNENERHEIASMVKIMSSLLVFESIEKGEIKVDEKITISHNAASMTGSELFIDEGAEYSVHDLLKGVIVVSANDACVALAERIAGNEDSFVAMMNERAKSLGMNDTLFVNATGLPAEGQYSTAKDVNTMTRELIKHESYYDYSKIWLEDYAHPSGRITQLANTNKLIRHYEGCDSGKTGFTNNALFCLSASASRNGMRLVTTVIGAKSSKERFKEVSDLFNHGFNNYSYTAVKKEGEIVENTVKVERGKKKTIELAFAEDIASLTKKGEKAQVELRYELPDKIRAGVTKGDKVGECHVYENGELVKKCDIIANETIEKASWFDNFKDFSNSFK
ncbi:MAG: D-alanyl-D-alanine carboxypeptidase [Clostridia bacterium]|jgi:D-alanyl-D-alanine carboxypeptidase (penicillin-binding protein 5/6)|nr:D-alanyl-D-alanine carboxypeptidase [Clostridia bacterium]